MAIRALAGERDEGENTERKRERRKKGELDRQTDRQRNEKYVATDKERGDKQS